MTHPQLEMIKHETAKGKLAIVAQLIATARVEKLQAELDLALIQRRIHLFTAAGDPSAGRLVRAAARAQMKALDIAEGDRMPDDIPANAELEAAEVHLEALVTLEKRLLRQVHGG